MSLNLNATFVGSSGDFTASQLYAGLNVDFSQLNWFERQWMAWYIWIGNPLIATGIASFILHEVRSLLVPFRQRLTFSHVQTVYFGRCIPWIIIDAIPYFRKWKLQPSKVPTPEEQWECTKGVLFSHFTVEGPAVSAPFVRFS
jgi:methylsterol monooxygenase